MKSVFIPLFTVIALGIASLQAEEGQEDQGKKIAELEAKVAALEAAAESKKDTAALEKFLAKNKDAARERMREDRSEYNSDELREIEDLYQVANNNWRSPEAKDSLEKLVKKYKKANRTGCALLYLAQYAEGEERENLLTKVVKNHSDCYYGNGCIVGGYGRYLLALHWLSVDEQEKATEVVAEIRKKYEEATGHRGQSILAITEHAMKVANSSTK